MTKSYLVLKSDGFESGCGSHITVGEIVEYLKQYDADTIFQLDGMDANDWACGLFSEYEEEVEEEGEEE